MQMCIRDSPDGGHGDAGQQAVDSAAVDPQGDRIIFQFRVGYVQISRIRIHGLILLSGLRYLLFYDCIILCMFCLTKDMDFSARYFIIKERMKEED